MKEELLAGYPISAFLQAQEGRDWKPDTRRRYSKYLYELGEYLAGQGPPGKAALERWQRQLEERCGPSGVKAYLAAANHYFRWCGRPDLVMRRHRGPEEAREGAGPPGLSRAEYLKLLRTARGMREHRTYLLVKLFATTGLPLQCLEQVTVEAVEAGVGELNYRGSPVEFRCPEGLRQELLAQEPDNGYYRAFEGGMRSLAAFVSGAEDRVVYWGTSGQRIARNYSFDSFCRSELLDSGRLLFGEDVRGAISRPGMDELRADVRRHCASIREYGALTGRSL